MFFEVNGNTWILQEVSPSSPNLRRSDGSYTLGVSDNAVKTVYISSTLNNAMFDKVLCHELTHVFSFENNLYLPIETEEIIADFMSLYGRDIIYLADNILNSVLQKTA